jgi:hypothetical protein
MLDDREAQQLILAGVERLIAAFEAMGYALTTLAAIETRRLEMEQPRHGEAKDAKVTKLKTEEELLREAQGESEEDLETWVGLREQEFDEKHAVGDSQKPKERSAATAERRRRSPASGSEDH